LWVISPERHQNLPSDPHFEADIEEINPVKNDNDNHKTTPNSSNLCNRNTLVLSSINTHQLNLLSSALVTFFQRAFEEQHVYDVEVVGATKGS
jgi:hypothetical protein